MSCQFWALLSALLVACVRRGGGSMNYDVRVLSGILWLFTKAHTTLRRVGASPENKVGEAEASTSYHVRHGCVSSVSSAKNVTPN